MQVQGTRRRLRTEWSWKKVVTGNMLDCGESLL